MRTMRTFPLLLLAALCAPALLSGPAAADPRVTEVVYVTGGYPHGTGACAGPFTTSVWQGVPHPVVHGACVMAIPRPGLLSVTVEDVTGLDVSFVWRACTTADQTCTQGSGVGAITDVEIPAHHDHVSVALAFGATTGTIRTA